MSETYRQIVKQWQDREWNTVEDVKTALENFRILFAYHSNVIENPEITYHDTREIFENGKVIKNEITKKLMVSRLPITLITVFIYLVLGFFFDLWHPGWILFIMIPVLESFISAIQNKNAVHFCYPVLVCAVYLILGCVWGLWHPWWILFLTVPIYYGIVNAFR